MKHYKKLLILLCVLCALTLTACHTESDPWPAGGNPASAPTETTAAATETPQTEPQATPPTIPGGDEEPGLNG